MLNKLQTSPVVIMSVAAFLWSLFPVLISVNAEYIGAAIFVLVINVSAGLSAALLGFMFLKNKRSFFGKLGGVIKEVTFDQWIFLSIIGVVSALYSFCFIIAVEMTSKVGAAIIIETWPIMAIFLAPLLITKNWGAVGFNDLLAAIIAMIGVILIMVGDIDVSTWLENNENFQNTEFVVGLLIAFMGSVFLALSVIFRAEVSNRLKLMFNDEDDKYLSYGFIGEAICRVLTVIPCLFLMMLFPEELNVTPTGLALSSFIGIFIFNIGSVAVTVALLLARSSSINMIYYISPILAVLWFYLLGVGSFTPSILLGGLLVIIANLLVLKKKKQQSVAT